MTEQTAPRLFISYSHDSREHEDRVLALADRLRADGVDAVVDQYNTAPPEGWPLWMDREIQKADFVALVCTEAYLRRVEGREEPGKGRGVLWESKLVYNHLYVTDTAVQKFIPILLEGGAPSSIPWPLRGLAYYQLGAVDGYQDFYGQVTGQRHHEKPDLGKLKALPAIAPQSYPASLEVRVERKSPTNLDRRNRLQMLKRVRLDWIDGVLQQSLYKVARIDVGLEETSDEVEQPLNAIVQVPDLPPTSLPAGTGISQVFDRQGAAMLILGAPGTGKTTLLLELAQELLERAERDESQPMPVVLNLSTWAVRRQSLTRWLITELNERSDVPKRVARRWVETEQVLPLLDGLDEVAGEHRQACVEAINEFRRDHGLLPIAVCSRVADYEALSTKLRLRNAVEIQPLTRPQVQGYLKRVGEPLRTLRVALENDPSLWELLETPLFLWVAMLAYGDAAVDLPAQSTIAQRRTRLLASFVDAMFKRRSAKARYSPEETAHWLSWLAFALSRNNQTVFYLEGLRSEWLATRPQKWLSRALTVILSGLLGGPVLTLSYGMVLAVVILFLKLSRVTIHSSPAHWLMLLKVTVGAGMGWARAYWLSIALSMGTVGAFLELRPVGRVRIALTGMSSRLGSAARVGLVLGLGTGLAVCSVFALAFRGGPAIDMSDPRIRAALATGVPAAWVGLVSVLSAALLSGLIVGLFAGLITLLASDSVQARRSPNQGTQRSMWTAIAAVGLFGLIGLLAWELFFRAASNPVPLLIVALHFGFSAGLIVGLIAGGLFCLKHVAVRLTLGLNGLAPVRYARFLDSAVDRLFLRRVGGGYIFAHRMLRDHFANLARGFSNVATQVEEQNERAIDSVTTEAPAPKWRDNQLLALGEITLLLLLLTLIHHFVPLGGAAEIVLFLFGWLSLRLRRVGWKGVGLGLAQNWMVTLTVGTLCGVGLALLDVHGILPVLIRVTGKPPHYPPLPPTIGIGTTAASVIGEWTMSTVSELACRGYFMNRLADVGRRTRTAWLVSLILTSMVYGSFSIGQGLTGVMEDTVFGLLLGLVYLASARNLSVPIVAHGVSNTIELLLLVKGKYPFL